MDSRPPEAPLQYYIHMYRCMYACVYLGAIWHKLGFMILQFLNGDADACIGDQCFAAYSLLFPRFHVNVGC